MKQATINLYISYWKPQQAMIHTRPNKNKYEQDITMNIYLNNFTYIKDAISKTE